MAGTREGGKRTAETIKSRLGDDYFRRLGAKGGRAIHTKPHGFALMSKERLTELGRLGGTISRRRAKGKRV